MNTKKRQEESVESSVRRHLRKMWRKANVIEKSQPRLSKDLRKQYWTEYREFKTRFVSL